MQGIRNLFENKVTRNAGWLIAGSITNKILANAYTERKNPITPMVLKNHLYWIVRLPASM